MALVSVAVAVVLMAPDAFAPGGAGTAAFAPRALWPGFGSPMQSGLILFAALGPGALSSSLQMFGQGRVSASQAQVRAPWERLSHAAYQAL